MAESSTNTGSQIEVNIRPPGGGDKKVPVKVDPSKTVAEFKQDVASATDIPAENQRLIYSGRVLKDEENVEVYRIRPGDTVHLVKGAAKAAPPPSQQQVPQNINTGNNIAGNPLAPLLNATNPGIGNFNPFAEMGVNTNDPNMMQNMMQSPQAQEQMRTMLTNPAVIDQIIDSSPELRQMGPHVREIMQSEQFRNMLSNPQQMAQMMQQANQMRSLFGSGGPGGMMSGLGGMGAFGGGQQQAGNQDQNQGPTNLFNPAAQQAASGAGAAGGAGGAGAGGQAGAGGMPDFAALSQLLGAGGGLGGLGGMGGFGGMGGSPQPAQAQDTRPPEERYATQLGQLQEMGFTNATVNVRALQASGGNVQAAIEYILNSTGW